MHFSIPLIALLLREHLGMQPLGAAGRPLCQAAS
jgi:hypothetical protein